MIQFRKVQVNIFLSTLLNLVFDLIMVFKQQQKVDEDSSLQDCPDPSLMD